MHRLAEPEWKLQYHLPDSRREKSLYYGLLALLKQRVWYTSLQGCRDATITLSAVVTIFCSVLQSETAVSIPDSDAAGEETFNGSPLECGEVEFRVQDRSPSNLMFSLSVINQ